MNQEILQINNIQNCNYLQLFKVKIFFFLFIKFANTLCKYFENWRINLLYFIDITVKLIDKNKDKYKRISICNFII